jgi:hypothetical protein
MVLGMMLYNSITEITIIIIIIIVMYNSKNVLIL